MAEEKLPVTSNNNKLDCNQQRAPAGRCFSFVTRRAPLFLPAGDLQLAGNAPTRGGLLVLRRRETAPNLFGAAPGSGPAPPSLCPLAAPHRDPAQDGQQGWGTAGLAAGQGRRVQGSGVHGSGVQGAWQKGAGQRGAVPHPAQPPAPSPSPSPAPLSCVAGTSSWCGQKTKQNQLLLQCFPLKAGTSEPVGS